MTSQVCLPSVNSEEFSPLKYTRTSSLEESESFSFKNSILTSLSSFHVYEAEPLPEAGMLEVE